MTIVLRFRSEDLLQCRFAISPLNETADALRSLTRRGAAAYHLAWRRQARQRVPGLRIGPLLAILSARGYQPDFLNPAPGSPAGDIGAELDRVRATPPGKVAAELRQFLDGQAAGSDSRREHPELGEDPAAVRDMLADMLARAWAALVEPWWPRIRDVLDADITYRARRLADAGVAAALGELDSHVSWQDGVLRFAAHVDSEMDVSGTELVLVPSVLAWPSAGICYDPPAIIYAARGAFNVWEPGRGSERDLERLLGRTRAILLRALAESASTTGLAARTGIPVSSVSEHLAVLRANGLMSTTRISRFLLHQRTEMGAKLAGGTGR